VVPGVFFQPVNPAVLASVQRMTLWPRRLSQIAHGHAGRIAVKEKLTLVNEAQSSRFVCDKGIIPCE
jgi:hypothetical protein